MEPIDSLDGWKRNPRRNGHAVQPVADSIRRFGFGAPVLARAETREIIAGHTRVKAARKIGMTEVPVRFLDLTEAEAHALALADNKLSELADWSEDLDAVLAEIRDDGADLSGLGWSDEEIVALLAPPAPGPSESDDEIPDVREEPDSEPGGLYELGPHRLYCGDCATVGLSDDVPGLEFYDPPWDSEDAAPATAASTLAFCDGRRAGDVVRQLGSPAWIFVWDCITSWWTKGRPLGRAKLCFWYGDLSGYNPDGAHYGEPPEQREVTNTRGTYQYVPDPRGKHLSDVFASPITRLHSQGEHSHAKPLDWVRMLIGNTSSGDVMDRYAGSGTSLIATAQLKRVWRGAEIDPRYCDVIRRRWTRWAREHGQDPGTGALEDE